MIGRVLVAVLLILSVASASAGEEPRNPNVKLEYRKPSAGLYEEVVISDSQRVIRTLSGDTGSGGGFEREETPRISPDGNFVYIGQVESAEVQMPTGKLKHHEVAYCNLVDLRSECIVARETGEFCGGEFARNAKWDNSLYPDFDLLSHSPKAIDLIDRRRAPANSAGTSLDNILLCDPPSASNIDTYREVVRRGMFDVSGDQKLAIEKFGRSE